MRTPSQHPAKRVEKSFLVESRSVRFTNFLDAESLDFERELHALTSDLLTEQTQAYLVNSSSEFYLMQMRSTDGAPAFQAAIYVARSRLLPFFATASVPRMSKARNEEEEVAIRALRECCRGIPGVMSLRLQPLRTAGKDLMDFQSRCARQGFQLADPIGVTRTLVLELDKSPDELMLRLHGKTRAKIRHSTRELVEIRALSDRKHIEACRKASGFSFKKTGDVKDGFDFEAAFALAAQKPDQATILGLFLKDRPHELVAYVMGQRNGKFAEYTSAGAFSSELKGIPFNYFLVWELSNWARDRGSVQMDLGGVTDGGENDPLRGISRFKRSLTDNEMETGREMVIELKPTRLAAYRALKRAFNPKPARQEEKTETVTITREKNDQRKTGIASQHPLPIRGLQRDPAPVLPEAGHIQLSQDQG